MNIIIYIFFSVISLTLICSCKTNENNYREAYLKAINKNIATDSITEARIIAEALPQLTTIDSTEVRIKSERLFPDYNAEKQEFNKYNIIVASFKQIFNAKSMTDRINQYGYNAFVLKNTDKQYYVVTFSTEIISIAIDKLEEIKQSFPITLRTPYPYIIKEPTR